MFISDDKYIIYSKKKEMIRMPVITIAGNNTINIENKRKMVEEVSEIVAERYGLPVEAITVLVQAYPKEDIGVGGKLLSEKK